MTKLRIPFTRPQLVDRPRLQVRTAEGLRGPLTLITAPAGFGKTTLVASGVANCGMPVAWLSLDKDDNQAGRFLNYLVTALQEADNTIGSEAAQLITASQQAPPEAVLTSLINDLDTVGGEIALVLDDYQYLTSKAAHAAVAFLLEHRPDSLHLVIATRSDPPLPLARLRARGQTVELRAADLRFTVPEAAQFLNEVMGLSLDAEAVTLLEERTEGWIAGLQMAALSMRDRNDKRGFIEGFSGTHRYILDYLLEEVLASQSPEVQRFLLCTSILERLTAPLCDAILKDEAGDTSIILPPSSVILEYLEQANLFLVPLDDERRWYRYHHLFTDLLRARLDQIYQGLAPRLHARAAAWLEQEKMMVEAVNHALAAGEQDYAARLVEENTTRLLAQGELNALMGWVGVLPAELRLARPWLCVHQAYALAFAGQLADVPPLLAQAEAAKGVTATQDATYVVGKSEETGIPSAATFETRAFKGAVAAIRAMTAVMVGQDGEAISQAQQSSELLPEENLWDRAAAAWALGYALRSLGRLREARAAFEEQIRLGLAMGNIWTLVTGLTDLANVVRAQGQIRQARALFEEALTEASKQGARSLGYIARMEASLASVLYEQNELEAANRLLTEAIAHTRQWPNPNHLAYAFALQARVLLAKGDLQGARSLVGKADQVRRSAALTRLNKRMVEAELIRVWLALQAAGFGLEPGDQLKEQATTLVEEWQDELVSSTENVAAFMDEGAETAAITLARVLLAAGRTEEALSLLERVTHDAQAAGHTERLINSLILTTIASRRSEAFSDDQIIAALPALEEALSLAESGGYVRVFLDEGQSMQVLIAQWLSHAGINPLRSYAVRLLSHFEAEPNAVIAAQDKVVPTGNLIEPLSQRELEVLRLIALGKTNLEIARQLIVSRGTIKAHAASIYRKLDVTNRTEAVARARQLGILP
ncbi:MAG TPA: LuxR C-terminal-related transcriptional regulator [Anaerolineales bacterium]|nr:LuxR C-terminal-related transcriptional regulator [Anaerolineales bacterium]